MKAFCFPCIPPVIILPKEEFTEFEEQNNQWANYLKEQAEAYIPKMKVPFGTYPKAKFFIYSYDKQRPLFQFVSTIYSDDQVIKIMKSEADKIESLKNVRYSVMKRINGVNTLLFQRDRVPGNPLTQTQKQFILDNEGKIRPMQIVKILNVSKWLVYSFRGAKGLVKSKKYHGNRRNQEIIKH